VPTCTTVDLTKCGTFDWKQQDYRGLVNITKSGLTCQPWAEQAPHYHYHLPALLQEANLIGNACRNPTGDSQAWCYTTSPDVIWEYCDVPFCTTHEERRKSFICGSRASKQADYRGNISVTESGRRCQHWASDFPHRHGTWRQGAFPYLSENQCRNPDGALRAWCYTEGMYFKKEVFLCHYVDAHELSSQIQSSNGSSAMCLSVRHSGKGGSHGG
jgi:plasminogen